MLSFLLVVAGRPKPTSKLVNCFTKKKNNLYTNQFGKCLLSCKWMSAAAHLLRLTDEQLINVLLLSIHPRICKTFGNTTEVKNTISGWNNTNKTGVETKCTNPRIQSLQTYQPTFAKPVCIVRVKRRTVYLKTAICLFLLLLTLV